MPSLDAHHANQEQKGEYAALAKWIEAEALANFWSALCIQTVRVKSA